MSRNMKQAGRRLGTGRKKALSVTARRSRPTCQIALVLGHEIVEIADDGLLLDECDAGAWIDGFNSVMRRTKWRACIVRPNSLPTSLPRFDLTCVRSRSAR